MSDEQTTATPPEDSKPKRKRTPEEIQAMREAMMAKRAARAAGQDVPADPPPAAAKEEAPPPEPAAETQATAAPAAAEKAEVAAEAAPRERPKSPGRKRTPEEIRAQREAMMAKRAAKAAGATAAETAAQAETPAAKPAAPVAAKPAAAAKKAPAKKKPAAKKPAAKGFERPQNITRREFLNLAWLSSMALITVQTLGVSVLFLFPRFKEGQFGGLFPIGRADSSLPELNAPPKAFNDGKFWLTNTDKGVYAIYKVCTHLGCLYAWADVTSRFECPCHGSKFSLTGAFIEGPAPRSLDRFVITAYRNGEKVAETPGKDAPNAGAGIQLEGDEELVIDTGQRIILPGQVEV